MRIGAGRFRNAVLPPAGPGVRPVPGRVRQSLFTVLLPRLEGARVLDLCAGVGGLGLEALSRGAASVVLVEKDPRALRALERWVADRRLGAEVRVVRADATYGGWPPGPYDLVFLDPPFETWGGAGGRSGAGGRPSPVGPDDEDEDGDEDGEDDEDGEAAAAEPAAEPEREEVWTPRRRRGRQDPRSRGIERATAPPSPLLFLERAVLSASPGGIVAVKLPSRSPLPDDARWRVLERKDLGEVGYALLVPTATP